MWEILVMVIILIILLMWLLRDEEINKAASGGKENIVVNIQEDTLNVAQPGDKKLRQLMGDTFIDKIVVQKDKPAEAWPYNPFEVYNNSHANEYLPYDAVYKRMMCGECNRAVCELCPGGNANVPSCKMCGIAYMPCAHCHNKLIYETFDSSRAEENHFMLMEKEKMKKLNQSSVTDHRTLST